MAEVPLWQNSRRPAGRLAKPVARPRRAELGDGWGSGVVGLTVPGTGWLAVRLAQAWIDLAVGYRADGLPVPGLMLTLPEGPAWPADPPRLRITNWLPRVPRTVRYGMAGPDRRVFAAGQMAVAAPAPACGDRGVNRGNTHGQRAVVLSRFR